MTINILSQNGVCSIRLEQYITYARQVVWIGAKSDEVYNTLTLDDVDVFQCSVAYDKTTDSWKLIHGQLRTHCSRGLKSDRSRACSMCKGCCGYIRTANPDYSHRLPTHHTLLNGESIAGEAMLSEGDTISFD